MLDASLSAVPLGRRLARSPWLAVLACELFVTAAEVFLKLAARDTTAAPPTVAALSWLGFNALGNPWTWAAIPCMIASFAAWIWVVSLVPLNIASLLSNVVHILVPLACLLFLHEHIPALRWLGIAVVCVGLALVEQSGVSAAGREEMAEAPPAPPPELAGSPAGNQK